MFDATKPTVRIGKNWKPPTTFDPKKAFKPKPEPTAFRHIWVEEPDGTKRDRIRVHLFVPITEDEKLLFQRCMFRDHDEWFGCACWSNEMQVRISIRSRDTEILTVARMEVGKHVDRALAEIYSARQKK